MRRTPRDATTQTMLIDISPKLTPDTAVFPGDTPLSREVLLDFARGDSLTLSTLRATVHLGAHADAPSHYASTGSTIDAQPLDVYLGPAQVITIPWEPPNPITPDDLQAACADIRAQRLLVRTNSWPDPTHFNKPFAHFHPDTIDALAKQSVRLVGIDTPSVDHPDSKDLPAHKAFFRNGINILECIDLTNAPDAMYELIALPLNLVGFDASPVRAVLRPLPTQKTVDLT